MTGQLKVLLQIDEMEIGGSQRQLVNLATGLRRNGVDVAVGFFLNRSYLIGELEREGVAVTCLRKRGDSPLQFIRRVRRFVRSGGYDLIHLFSWSAEIWTTLATLDLPVARISSIRGVYEWYSPLNWFAKRFVTRQSAAVIANSAAGLAFAQSRGVNTEGRAWIIPNGIHVQSQFPGERMESREALGLSRDEVVGVVVGRLVPIKNLTLVLKALQSLMSGGNRPPVVLVAGDGPERPALERLARELGVAGTVKFLGSSDNVRRILVAADFSISTSIKEGISNSILEAMEAGMPVIASRVGGTPELVEDGSTGIMFPSNDHVALAAAMQRLTTDAAERRRLGAAARARIIANYSVDRMVESTLQVYRLAAGAKNGH
jgi:glycosyltransferase involved in cell wall biosynthesis